MENMNMKSNSITYGNNERKVTIKSFPDEGIVSIEENLEGDVATVTLTNTELLTRVLPQLEHLYSRNIS
jgi:hypothetical protein